MVEFPLSGKWFWIMETQRLLKVQKKMHQHLDWTSRMLCCVRSRNSREVEEKNSHPFKRAGFFLSTGLVAKLLVDHSLHWKRPRLKNHPPLLRSENILSKFLFTISDCEWFPDVPMFFSNKNTPSWASLNLTAKAMWKRHRFSGARLTLGSYRTNLFPENMFRKPIGIHGKMLKVYLHEWYMFHEMTSQRQNWGRDLASPKFRDHGPWKWTAGNPKSWRFGGRWFPGISILDKSPGVSFGHNCLKLPWGNLNNHSSPHHQTTKAAAKAVLPQLQWQRTDQNRWKHRTILTRPEANNLYMGDDIGGPLYFERPNM